MSLCVYTVCDVVIYYSSDQTCFSRMYRKHIFDDTGMSGGGFNIAQAPIEEFKEFHPSSVLVIVIESECSHFN